MRCRLYGLRPPTRLSPPPPEKCHVRVRQNPRFSYRERQDLPTPIAISARNSLFSVWQKFRSDGINPNAFPPQKRGYFVLCPGTLVTLPASQPPAKPRLTANHPSDHFGRFFSGKDSPRLPLSSRSLCAMCLHPPSHIPFAAFFGYLHFAAAAQGATSDPDPPSTLGSTGRAAPSEPRQPALDARRGECQGSCRALRHLDVSTFRRLGVSPFDFRRHGAAGASPSPLAQGGRRCIAAGDFQVCSEILKCD